MDEQSYEPIVPVKVGNRRASARSGHGTHWREGGTSGRICRRKHRRDSELEPLCPQKLDRLTELAKEEPKRQFFSIAHLITPEALYAAFRSLRKEASAGVDGVTYRGVRKGRRERRSKSFISGSKTASTKPSRCAGSTYRRRTGSRDRSRFPLWRTRSCRRRWWKC